MKACGCKHCHRDVGLTERGGVRTAVKTRRGPASSKLGRGLVAWKGCEIWGGGRGTTLGDVTGQWMHPLHPMDGSGCREEAPDGGQLAFVAFKIILRDQRFLFSQFFLKKPRGWRGGDLRGKGA